MEDAPTKLKVSVTVSDADWQKMQELHAQWLGQEEQKLADYNQQQETIWQKQSQRLTDIVKSNEGIWISTKLFYVVGSLLGLHIHHSLGIKASGIWLIWAQVSGVLVTTIISNHMPTSILTKTLVMAN